MSAGLVGLYAIYFVLVGIKGNAGSLKDGVLMDGKGFLPFVIAILVLRAAYTSDTLKPLVKPFVVLAALTFIVKNYGKIIPQINKITGLNLPSGA
jgi:hypothetical protein